MAYISLNGTNIIVTKLQTPTNAESRAFEVLLLSRAFNTYL